MAKAATRRTRITPPPPKPQVTPSGGAKSGDDWRTAEVRLRPFAGVSPTVYVPASWAVGVALILFLALLLPGLRFNGSIVSVTSIPSGATIWIDDQLRGTTPASLRILTGPHSVRVDKQHFKASSQEVDLGGRLVGSLLVPRRAAISAVLSPETPTAYLDAAARDFAGNPHIPHILRDALSAAAEAQLSGPLLSDFLYDVIPHVNSKAALGQVVAAATGAGPISAAGVRQAVSFFSQAQARYEGLPYWLAAILPMENKAILTESGWFSGNHAAYLDEVEALAGSNERGAGPGGPIQVAGLFFRPIPEGRFLFGDDRDLTRLRQRVGEYMPQVRTVAGFFMEETEVSNQAFLRFVQAVPDWAPANRTALVTAGVASDDYLSHWDGDAPTPFAQLLPVTNVSYFAAAAFARWVGTQLPASLAGWTARLPDEVEWEWASRGGRAGVAYPEGASPGSARVKAPGVTGPSEVGTSLVNSFGLHDTYGNVWEWTDTWYAPSAYLLLPRDGYGPRLGAERVVRGGSWANEPEIVRLFTRGAQPPSWATDYLGFRVAIMAAD